MTACEACGQQLPDTPEPGWWTLLGLAIAGALIAEIIMDSRP